MSMALFETQVKLTAKIHSREWQNFHYLTVLQHYQTGTSIGLKISDYSTGMDSEFVEGSHLKQVGNWSIFFQSSSIQLGGDIVLQGHLPMSRYVLVKTTGRARCYLISSG